MVKKPMTKRDDNILYRIEQLERNYYNLDQKIELLLTNHLPHLREDMISLKTRINLMTAVNIGGIILGLLATRFLK